MHGVRTAIERLFVAGGALGLLGGCGLQRNGLDFGEPGTTTSSSGSGIASGSSSTITLTSTSSIATTGSGSSRTTSSTASDDAGSDASGVTGGDASTTPGDDASTVSGNDASSPGVDGSTTPGDDGSTGADGSSADGSSSAPCSGGWVGQPSSTGGGGTTVGLFGYVQFAVSTGNQVTAMHTSLVVPDLPPASGTVELTPSLRPNPLAIGSRVPDLGTIQPTLSWGPTCAPSSPNNQYQSWWADGEYVNAGTNGPMGCQGGMGMAVKVGDTVEFDLSLSGKAWTEAITDDRNGRSVSFNIDLGGQPEVFPTFAIVTNGQSPVGDIVFGATTVTLASPEPTACQPALRGPTDSFATPAASPDGLQCCLPYIVLRAQGVPATTSL